MIDNVLFLTRLSNGNINSKPDTYTIWDAYKDGLKNNIKSFYAYDYYDLYFGNGKKGSERIIENYIIKYKIKYLFIGFAAEDFTFDLEFLYLLKQKYNFYFICSSQDPETFFESRDRYYFQLSDCILHFANPALNSFFNMYSLNCYPLYSLYNKDFFTSLNLKKDIDVSFIGNVNKANRREYISYLEENGIKVETYGVGSKNGFVNHDKMINIMNRSKINLNFTDSAFSTHFDFNTNTNFTIGTKINSRIQQAKGRLIEIFLTKSFCLSQDGIGTRILFDNHNIVYDSKEELLYKIKYFLKNEEERSAIVEMLYLEALTFDSSNRFKEILPTLKFKNINTNNIYIDKDFLINYCSYHFLYFFNFLFKGKFSFAYEELRIFFKYKEFDYKTIYFHFKMQMVFAYKRFRKSKK